MTAIPKIEDLSAAGIDSLERLAVALGLFLAKKTSELPDTDQNFEAISFQVKETSQLISPAQQTFESAPLAAAYIATLPTWAEYTQTDLTVTVEPYTIIDAKLSFNCYFRLSPETRLEAGTLLLNIEPFFSVDPIFPETEPSTEPLPAIPAFPEDLTNAEQLMVWALGVLNASLYPESKTYIRFLPHYEDNELEIQFDFPLDSQAISRNSYQLIGSVKRLVNGYLDLDTGLIAQIGLNAYDVALASGFVGSQEEWLASLVGPAGPVGPQGPPGTPGAGVTWKGIWNAGDSYAAQDAVHHEGSSYIANAPNTNKVPGVATEWDLWVEQGEMGPAGADGAAGSPGESAYDLWKQGTPGGTIEQFFAYIKGADGEPGQDGAPGTPGTLTAAGSVTFDLVAEPATPAPDKLVIWASALDGLIYKKDDQGIVEAIGTGTGGASLTDIWLFGGF